MRDRTVLIPVLLLLVVSTIFPQLNKKEKITQLNERGNVKVTEIEKDLFRIEYLNGEIKYKNTTGFVSSLSNQDRSPNFDSTIIDLRNLDTSSYYQKYSYWQEVKIGSASQPILVGDLNNNSYPELYGIVKDYNSDYSDITVMELTAQNKFKAVFSYDSTGIARSIYDVDKDGMDELLLIRNYRKQVDSNLYDLVKQHLFFKKNNGDSLAKILSFIFQPYPNNNSQQNDNYFGDWDGDEFTDQICIFPTRSINIYEYNPSINNFDSVYYYDTRNDDLYYGGFSIGDFDEDGKTEFFAASVHGKVRAFENIGDNSYAPIWQGMVETYNAYLLTQTNDLDRNGKKEIWIGGDAFYNGVPITRITIFESNGGNSYLAVGKIDIIGVVSFDAGNLQVIDVDKDGQDEVMLCIDQHVLIFRFNGSLNRQTYEPFYIKRNDYESNHYVYEGAVLYDFTNDGKEELVINMFHVLPFPSFKLRLLTHIFKPDFTVDVKKEDNFIPGEFNLYQNYPNPFNPITTIKFDISEFTPAYVKVYNILGKEITTLIHREFSPGSYKIDWDAKSSGNEPLPSGIYIIRLITNNYSKSIKAILLK